MNGPLDLINLYYPVGRLCIVPLTEYPGANRSDESIANLSSFKPAKLFGGT
jgi:hypothetical protein